MFFFLSKILNFALSPLFWIFILMILAWVFIKDKKGKKWVLLSITLLYIFSNRFIFVEVMRPWEIPAINTDTLDTYDMAIVLGGMMDYDQELDRMQVFKGFDRIVQATDLYARGKIRKIFISGGSGSLAYPEMKEAKIIKEYFVRIGLPEEDILYEDISRNTYENAIFTRDKLEEEGMLNQDFLLITSGFHMRRSLACFDKAGIKTQPFSTDRYSGPTRFDPDYLLIPDAEILSNWKILIKEWIGIVAYKVAGYI